MLFSGLISRRKSRLPVPAWVLRRSSALKLNASQKPLGFWLWKPLVSNLVSRRVGSGSLWCWERYRFSLWGPEPRESFSLRRSRSSAESNVSSWGMEEILKEMCTLVWSFALGLSSRGSEKKRQREDGNLVWSGLRLYLAAYICDFCKFPQHTKMPFRKCLFHWLSELHCIDEKYMIRYCL